MHEKNNPSFLGPALIILAGIFWGSMGIFVRRLSSFGFAPIQITSIRLTLAAVGFCLIQLILRPGGLSHLYQGSAAFPRAGCGQCPVLFLLLFHRDQHDVPLYCRNPSLYLPDLDHADVRALFP